MSLLALAQATKQGFNPAEDKINGASSIPVGEYDAVISKVEFKVYDSGWENILITADIVTGDYAGRKELIGVSFIEEWKGKEIPKFSLERSMKLVQKLAFVGDYAFQQSDFDDTYALSQALNNAVGTQLVLTIKESPNKKDPSNPYRSYELDKYDQPAQETPNFAPERENEQPVDVTASDVPF